MQLKGKQGRPQDSGLRHYQQLMRLATFRLRLEHFKSQADSFFVRCELLEQTACFRCHFTLSARLYKAGEPSRERNLFLKCLHNYCPPKVSQLTVPSY